MASIDVHENLARLVIERCKAGRCVIGVRKGDILSSISCQEVALEVACAALTPTAAEMRFTEIVAKIRNDKILCNAITYTSITEHALGWWNIEHERPRIRKLMQGHAAISDETIQDAMCTRTSLIKSHDILLVRMQAILLELIAVGMCIDYMVFDETDCQLGTKFVHFTGDVPDWIVDCLTCEYTINEPPALTINRLGWCVVSRLRANVFDIFQKTSIDFMSYMHGAYAQITAGTWIRCCAKYLGAVDVSINGVIERFEAVDLFSAEFQSDDMFELHIAEAMVKLGLA